MKKYNQLTEIFAIPSKLRQHKLINCNIYIYIYKTFRKSSYNNKDAAQQADIF